MTRTVTSPPSCSTRTRAQRLQQHERHDPQDAEISTATEPPPSTSAFNALPLQQHICPSTDRQIPASIYTHDQPPLKRPKIHHTARQLSGPLPLRARDAQCQSHVVSWPVSPPKGLLQPRLVNIRSGAGEGDDGSRSKRGGCLSFARPNTIPSKDHLLALPLPTRTSPRHPRPIHTDEGGMAATDEGIGAGMPKNEHHLKTIKEPTATVSTANEKRSLRSQDGAARPSKSELAMYFPNYEQVLSLKPVEKEFLDSETAITLIDDAKETLPGELETLTLSRVLGNPLENLHDAEIVESLSAQRSSGRDPLDEEIFFKAHRRLERQEKQLRNLEKERAQYEKTQLEHLLGELQGHDWLRVMGINGITDSEKKLYEPKRDYFLGEVTALLEKFRAWKEEEKRRRVEREQALQAEEDEEESDSEDETNDGEGEDESDAVDESSENTSPTAAGGVPDPEDVDGLAAHQLYQEVISASKSKKLRTDGDDKSVLHPQYQSQSRLQHEQQPLSEKFGESRPTVSYPEPDPWVAGPFVSFYSKPHLREAAIKRHKRGRTRTAFGKPLPELNEQPFRLPDDILTPEAIRASQRRNRRIRREGGRT